MIGQSMHEPLGEIVPADQWGNNADKTEGEDDDFGLRKGSISDETWVEDRVQRESLTDTRPTISRAYESSESVQTQIAICASTDSPSSPADTQQEPRSKLTNRYTESLALPEQGEGETSRERSGGDGAESGLHAHSQVTVQVSQNIGLSLIILEPVFHPEETL